MPLAHRKPGRTSSFKATFFLRILRWQIREQNLARTFYLNMFCFECRIMSFAFLSFLPSIASFFPFIFFLFFIMCLLTQLLTFLLSFFFLLFTSIYPHFRLFLPSLPSYIFIFVSDLPSSSAGLALEDGQGLNMRSLRKEIVEADLF